MSRQILLNSLKTKDRSAYILSQYYPSSTQNAFIGLRAFNLETLKIVDSANEPVLARIKLDFWKSNIQKMFSTKTTEQELQEPVASIIHKAIAHDGIKMHKKYLLTMVQTQTDRLEKRPIRTIETMQQYGEGIYSQMNYATLEMLLDEPSQQYLAANQDLDEMVSNICAHIGQASGIVALLKGFNFYAQRHNFLNLPVKLLQQANINEQQILDSIEAKQPVPGLENVVFEVATKANDHLLTAKSLMQQFQQETGTKIPYWLVLPAMSAVPVQMYLQHLQTVDFDLNRSVAGDWKLPWKTWRTYRSRSL